MKELIIKDLQEIAKQLEKTPTRTEYFEITSLKISRKTILKYFDSYTDAIEQAGLNRKPIYVKCDYCQIGLTRTPSTLSEHNFCNHSCSAKFTNPLKKSKKFCKLCDNELNAKHKIFCNHTCQMECQYNEYIEQWQEGNKLGYIGKVKAISKHIRKYMLIKYNNTCQECGWNKLHPVDNKPLVEIDHIDGDASNCKESNLRVLCPNCHSMTSTFRARNKNSARDRS